MTVRGSKLDKEGVGSEFGTSSCQYHAVPGYNKQLSPGPIVDTGGSVSSIQDIATRLGYSQGSR